MASTYFLKQAHWNIREDAFDGSALYPKMWIEEVSFLDFRT